MSGYLNVFKENKCLNLLVKVDQLLKKYNKIWDKISKGNESRV